MYGIFNLLYEAKVFIYPLFILSAALQPCLKSLLTIFPSRSPRSFNNVPGNMVTIETEIIAILESVLNTPAESSASG